MVNCNQAQQSVTGCDHSPNKEIRFGANPKTKTESETETETTLYTINLPPFATHMHIHTCTQSLNTAVFTIVLWCLI